MTSNHRPRIFDQMNQRCLFSLASLYIVNLILSFQEWLTWKLIPKRTGSTPAIAVPIGCARAMPDIAIAVPTGLEAATPCSPITAKPEIQW